MAGRPSKLTPEVQQRLLQAIASGNTRKDAALYAGISVGTLEDWIGRGRGGGRRPAHPPYVAFVDALEKAEAQAVVRNVAIIQKAAADTWQAAAWWLERRRPDDWGRKERVEHSTAPERPMEVRHDTSDRLGGYLDTIAQVLSGLPPDDAGSDGAAEPVDPDGPDPEAGGVSG